MNLSQFYSSTDHFTIIPALMLALFGCAVLLFDFLIFPDPRQRKWLLIFVVLAAFAAGVAAGLLAGAFKVARLKRQLSRLRREQRASLQAPGPHGAAPGTTPASGPGFEPPPSVM